MMFASIAWPTFPDVAAAPTTAIEVGARIGRSAATAPTWSRSPIRCRTASLGVCRATGSPHPATLCAGQRSRRARTRPASADHRTSPRRRSDGYRAPLRSPRAALASACRCHAPEGHPRPRTRPRQPASRAVRCSWPTPPRRRHDGRSAQGDQPQPPPPGTGDGVGTAVTVEAQIPALGREAVEERFDIPEVLWCGSLQAQRRPIAKQHVTNQRMTAHRRHGRQLGPGAITTVNLCAPAAPPPTANRRAACIAVSIEPPRPHDPP